VGKRADAVLHSAGALSSVCLVEIKRHDTNLLEPVSYRAGAWRAAEHLSGGIAQCHANTASLIREGQKLIHKDKEGFTTGKVAYVTKPRCYLIIGSLKEFKRGDETNDAMYLSFENLRRSVNDPEMVTFDELYERAERVFLGMEEESLSHNEEGSNKQF
jgi:hypothetical protein